MGEDPRERDLQDPEAEQVEEGGRPSVDGAVERAREHHAERIEGETRGDDPEAIRAHTSDLGVVGEEADEDRCHGDEHDSEEA